MIFKNEKLGNVEGVTIVEMGKGDVKVSYVHQPIEKYAGIIFCDDVPGEIGRRGPRGEMIGLTTDELPPGVMLQFTEIESIEVVEEHLRKAKIRLKQILKTK